MPLEQRGSKKYLFPQTNGSEFFERIKKWNQLMLILKDSNFLRAEAFNLEKRRRNHQVVMEGCQEEYLQAWKMMMSNEPDRSRDCRDKRAQSRRARMLQEAAATGDEDP
ncbi:hypothetical protein AOXY_G10396 [Acipenser oxyrinchus oxyrinchus]|uniref:Uncharacterized protein n=1 Tax=Acipenser oxyrinchus oxyrinchus TaxID=40147 RepID=A0AAD8DE95_ACIOX|nr:hypothetical protein AOXY_G10396 [Acipenser oxyrinchus oxyrinchus]